MSSNKERSGDGTAPGGQGKSFFGHGKTLGKEPSYTSGLRKRVWSMELIYFNAVNQALRGTDFIYEPEVDLYGRERFR